MSRNGEVRRRAQQDAFRYGTKKHAEQVCPYKDIFLRELYVCAFVAESEKVTAAAEAAEAADAEKQAAIHAVMDQADSFTDDQLNSLERMFAELYDQLRNPS